MTATASAYAGSKSIAVDRALSMVSRFPLWKLRDARVLAYETPDPSNPPGYWHLSVKLKYRTWFGIVRIKCIYLQLTAFEKDEQDEVVGRVQRLILAINSL